jgi:hypothetical protein
MTGTRRGNLIAAEGARQLLMTETAEEVVTVGLLLRPAAYGRGGGEPMDVARKAEEDTVEILPESIRGKKDGLVYFILTLSSLSKVH